MLEAVCPNGHHLQVPLEHAGMKLRCPAPGCGAIFQLSASSPTGTTVPVGPSGAPMPSGVGLGAAAPPAPQQPPAAPPQPAPQQPSYGVQQPAPQPPAPAPAASQPLNEAQGSRWTGTDQPQPQTAPLQRSGSGVMPRPFPTRAAPWIAWAQGLLMIGLVLVLTARGCDGLGARNIGRLKAKADLAQREFESVYQDELAGLQAELTADKVTEKQKTDINKKIDELTKAHEKDRATFSAEKARMDNDAYVATSANIAWGYWREMLFVVGTILFSLGLLAIALGGQGAERYICFGMLAIIVFSLYVAGAAWFTSIVGGLSGLGAPLR